MDTDEALDEAAEKAAFLLRFQLINVIGASGQIDCMVILNALAQTMASVLGQLPEAEVVELLDTMVPTVSGYEAAVRKFLAKPQLPKPTVRGASGHG